MTKNLPKILQAGVISIHTPAKGVTFLDEGEWVLTKISIHTPAKGVTSVVDEVAALKKFQSTLPRRE
ncbi:hypothetical protein CLONEX_01348 [[Clostridium] nexile DSM 1787]|nr:hypothetical protein CLONEX_01348 [[Clostridium] nexile DSM 1787]